MFMRFVEVRVQPDRLEDFERFYSTRIAPALRDSGGCLYATLLSNSDHPSECLSLTLWDSAAAAQAFESGGRFDALVEEAEPYLWRTAEWRIRLSPDLTLDYSPVHTPPTVEAFPVEVERQAADMGSISPNMYVRIVSGRSKPGKSQRLIEIFEEEVVPALLATDGCRYVFLARGRDDDDEVLSVTLWESRAKADEYVRHGRFDELLRKVEPYLASGIQWQMTLDQTRKTHETASDDAHVEGFQVVASETFE